MIEKQNIITRYKLTAFIHSPLECPSEESMNERQNEKEILDVYIIDMSTVCQRIFVN